MSETCKYLYLLFDIDNPINKNGEQYIFTTEGHVFPVRDTLRSKIWGSEYDEIVPNWKSSTTNVKNNNDSHTNLIENCQNVNRNEGGLPLQNDYLAQIFHQIGAEFS